MVWRANPAAAGTAACVAVAGAAAAAFLAATAVTGPYTLVARLGGAGWVFLLAMIILLPTLMPWVQERLSRAPTREEGAMATVIDPVCSMAIDPSRAAGKETYQGQAYFFCSESCWERFRAEPSQYVGSR